jgi:alpha-beta hydrolase superfamily lysophospholipase
MKQEINYKDPQSYEFKKRVWQVNEHEGAIIIAIHGYNDYSESFQIPATFLKKYKISTISFDLRGFGMNEDRGNWFPLSVHIDDVTFFVKEIRKNHPKKKIFLLGESMGGAIVSSTVMKNKNLQIDGVILVAPAIWNFSEMNPIKKIFLNVISTLLPNLKLDGGDFIKVTACNNIEVLKALAKDKYFIHKPNLKSLNGIVDLMDESYKYTKEFLNQLPYRTLIILPIKDEIVPRKPLTKLLNDKKDSIKDNVTLAIFKNNYHMILRDLESETITKFLANWINNLDTSNSISESINILNNSKFYHITEK